jgi:glutamate/tyrosine decarboxylase-like PLP-dependent enzyme
MTLEIKSPDILKDALETLDKGFSHLPPLEHDVDMEALKRVMDEVAQLMQNNYPYHHPFYLGQMLKPPHPVARLAYALSLWINPNNHALDGGIASSAMEKEAVAQIAGMFGWKEHLGHLCSGGTMANLEGLWVAGRLNPGRVVLASGQAHYTHSRISSVLGIPFQSIPCDSRARMDISALRERLQTGDVGTVVATIGTTATGSVDPLPEILELREEYGFRVHADAAYGGYFILTDNLRPETKGVYEHLQEVDSIVIDPHKHGLQPYGCGCVLFRDPSVGKFYKHDSPYTYFTSEDLHLGEISLECSRPGASATALWATMRMFPLTKGGEFAMGLASGREACLDMYSRLESDPRFKTAFEPELDIVIFVAKAQKVTDASALSEAIFQRAAEKGLHMAVARFPASLLGQVWPDMDWDSDHISCLRCCLMKPQHKQWMDRIWTELDRCAREVLEA